MSNDFPLVLREHVYKLFLSRDYKAWLVLQMRSMGYDYIIVDYGLGKPRKEVSFEEFEKGDENEQTK